MGSACRKPEAQPVPVNNGTTTTTQRVRQSKEIVIFCTPLTVRCSQQRICGVIYLIKSVNDFSVVYRGIEAAGTIRLVLDRTTARNFLRTPTHKHTATFLHVF